MCADGSLTGWAISLAGLAFILGILLGFRMDSESGCERASQEYFLSVQVSGAGAEATRTAGVAFAVECDLPLFPAVPSATPTVTP